MNTFNTIDLVVPAQKIKKCDKPVLKPIEQKKRGRKRKPIAPTTRQVGEFVITFT
jgi:hypothetical protein